MRAVNLETRLKSHRKGAWITTQNLILIQAKRSSSGEVRGWTGGPWKWRQQISSTWSRNSRLPNPHLSWCCKWPQRSIPSVKIQDILEFAPFYPKWLGLKTVVFSQVSLSLSHLYAKCSCSHSFYGSLEAVAFSLFPLSGICINYLLKWSTGISESTATFSIGHGIVLFNICCVSFRKHSIWYE